MDSNRTHGVRIHAQGRIVIPSDLRQAMKLREGEHLLARLEGGRLILERRSAILHRLRSVFQFPAGAGAGELELERNDDAGCE